MSASNEISVVIGLGIQVTNCRKYFALLKFQIGNTKFLQSVLNF